jgi:hypothetical protein
MIKIDRGSLMAGEGELVATASRFFADRLIPAAQQKKIQLTIEVTGAPRRMPIAIKWLVCKPGFFVDASPRHFEMTVSIAAGAKDALENTANEITHIAQIVSGRLRIYLKSRKIQGVAEQAYAASWLGKKRVFIDMTPRSERSWETEASIVKTMLVEEFLSWSAGQLSEFSAQKADKSRPALFPLSKAVIAAQQSMLQIAPMSASPVSQAVSVEAAVHLANRDNGASMCQDTFSTELQPRNQSSAKLVVAETLSLNNESIHSQNSDDCLNINIGRFNIAVEVPRLGTERMLDSLVLHGKLKDLLERGLIPYEAARAAIHNAQNSQQRR